MDFAADFTAIDFETASRRSDSACQLAAVKVRGGKILDSAMWMIRPQPLYFSPMNIRIHGIDADRVRDEPVFGELWPEIAERIGDDCLVAHNASFDMGVLLACLRKSRRTISDFHYTCTRAIARRAWPQRNRYGLKPLSEWLGIQFRHHDALEDSIACAKVLLAAGIARQAVSLPDLESRLRLSRGRAGEWGMKGPMQSSARSSRRSANSSGPARSRKRSYADPRDAVAAAESKLQYTHSADQGDETTIDFQRLLVRADFIRPLRGKQIVFEGRLRLISNEQAEQLAIRSGGQCEATVTGQTHYVVVGTPEIPSGASAPTTEAGAAVDPGSGEATTHGKGELADIARQLRQRAPSIRVLDEQEFLSLVVAPPGT